ncbi:MAG: mechanosensitive ion channel protein MscS, partial [Proteiniphilum sp.]|nr:mechanosensitive ion channel protein MscS [Proteiniphilum sp.]
MNEEKIDQISRSTNAISEWSIQLLTNAGISENWVKYINLLLLLSVLVVLVFMVQYLTRRILHSVLKRVSTMTGIEFLRHLSERRFPHYLAMIIPFSLVKG